METQHLIYLAAPPPEHGGGSSRSLLAVLGVWPRRLLHRGKSECCCHPHRPIQFAGHKSAPRPGSSGRGKMECDGLVLTNSGGAPSPHLASHHSPRTPPSPLLLPTASGPVASSRPRQTPSLPFMNSPPVSSSFISSALLSRERRCN